METDLIIVREYCQKSHVDPLFIVSLEEDGLIDIQVVDGLLKQGRLVRKFHNQLPFSSKN